MPFRELSAKQKARVTFTIRGPRSEPQQKAFKTALLKLLEQNGARLETRKRKK